MTFARLTADRNSEQIQEADHLTVPGNPLFQKDSLCKWLEANSNANGLNVNLSLLYHKYPWWFDEGGGKLSLEKKFVEIIERHGELGTRTVSHQYKNEILDAVSGLSAFPPADYDQIRDRHYLAPDGVVITALGLKTKTRLVVGLSGGDSVIDVGITLHPYYGFPFIPGSSIKGVTRHFSKEYDGWSERDLVRIFGGKDETVNKDFEGDVVFYDAWPEEYPTEGSMLERDVMAIHYQEYYNEKGFPADNSGVVPINFLAVSKGVKFRFALRPSCKCKDRRTVEAAKNQMVKALEKFGVGSKTDSSYGYFEEV